MLCLPEHGGMVVVMRDWLGGEDHMMPLWDGNPEDIDRKELKELLLDKEALKTNDVVVIAQVRKPINYVDCRAKKRDAEQMSRELLELEALDTQLPMLHLPLSILKQA
jgi:acyl-CoA synthetase (AMP-forming)/AMP-acid ligase II